VKPCRSLTARVAVLDRADVDTDQIIPARFLKGTRRDGLGAHLFADRPDAPLGTGAAVLVAGRNFGCGSSREHAAWALQEAGYDVVIAPSFGDIFRTNSLKVGLLPVTLPADEMRQLLDAARGGLELTVDLEARQLVGPDGRVVPFELDDYHRERLLEGLDDIALTLRREPEIDEFERTHPARVDTAPFA
jgi:3-isopropylmalate/(R)-2-methylmalate dehydratase small subunit